MDYEHRPVMPGEVIRALEPRSGGVYVDATVGGGGHAAMVLEKSAPDGFLYACDCDDSAVEAALERLAPFHGRFDLRRANFDTLGEWVPAGLCDGVLLDLGVSSAQLESGERGFSIYRESELDMRMDRRSALTAARVVNEFDASELARVFRRYGDERFAGRISRAIETRRRRAPLRTTTELAALIEGAVPMRTGRIHPATRVFQALRIVVNDEYGVLERGLEAAWRVLKVGGRLVVISFHSGEARIVKEFGRTLSRNYEVEGDVDEPEFRRPRPPRLRNLTRSPVMPGEKEQKRNPKARSAQMRVFEKIYAP